MRCATRRHRTLSQRAARPVAWPHAARAEAGQHGRGEPHPGAGHRDGNAGGAVWRRHRARRRPDPAHERQRDHRLDVAHEPHPRNRHRLGHRDRGSRRGAPDPSRRGRRGRPAVSAVAGLAGQLPDRRQSVVQRRRHRRSRLRQRARALPRRRGGAAGRSRVRRSAQAEEGQYRLRSQEPVRRRGRHARHHHRRGAEAVSEAEGQGGRLGRRANRRKRRWNCSRSPPTFRAAR